MPYSQTMLYEGELISPQPKVEEKDIDVWFILYFSTLFPLISMHLNSLYYIISIPLKKNNNNPFLDSLNTLEQQTHNYRSQE